MRQFNSPSLLESADKSFNFNKLPSISAFPKDEKNWRIDWFGEIAFPNRLIRRKQPSVLIHLSRVINDHYNEDPTLLLSPESTSPARFQRKVWVSVGTMPMLRIGDIWRNGELIARPEYKIEHFLDLHIDRSTTHLIKAGLNLEEQGFLLPLTEHPWHMQCTHSYCALIDLPDNRRLIIPCMELIRFYFGSSSNLITKLFLPPLNRQSLYDNPRFDRATKHLSFDLAENISGSSAADIGRLHLDPIAWRVALLISTSALAASVSNQAIHPQTYFPFEGSTDLIATGKWLSFGVHQKATFIVYNLRTCSHPFPFRSLCYKTKIKDAKPDVYPPNESIAPQSQQSLPRKSALDAETQNLLEQDASNSLAPKTKNLRFETRFPDLRRKSISKNKLLTQSENQTFTGIFSNTINNTAVGDPGSEQRIRSVDLAILSKDKSRPPAPLFLQEIVETFMELDGVTIELLTESEEDGWTIPVVTQSNEDGEVDLAFSIEGESKGVRLRRTCAFSLKRNSQYLTVALIEDSPVFWRSYHLTLKEPRETRNILMDISKAYIDHIDTEGHLPTSSLIQKHGD